MYIHLTSPENKSVVSQRTKEHISFMENGGTFQNSSASSLDWLHLERQGKERSFPRPVIFTWETKNLPRENCRFLIVFSYDPDFKTCWSVSRNQQTYATAHFLLGQTVYWYVSAYYEDQLLCSSEIGEFSIDPIPPRWIQVEGLSNVRDLGGWLGMGGKRIRQGLIFRGCEMEFHHTITEKGKNTLLYDLQIQTELDLREEAVGKIKQSALGRHVNYFLIPAKAYGDFLKQEEQMTCQKLFRLFLDKERYPFYIHCWGGADRTGTLLFLLGGILGMSEKDLFLDYELTSFSIWGERSIHSKLFGSLLEGLQSYGSKDDSLSQKCENYLLSTGITTSELNAIRTLLLEH